MANEMTVQKTESLSNSEAFTNKVLKEFGSNVAGSIQVTDYQRQLIQGSWVIRSETKGTYAPPWIIVGAETGQQKNKTIPQAEWVQHILEFSQAHGSKVFLKNNLAPYFTGELVQDFPFSYPPKNLG